MSCRMQLLIGLAVCLTLSLTCIVSEALVLPVDDVHAMQGECIIMVN